MNGWIRFSKYMNIFRKCQSHVCSMYLHKNNNNFRLKCPIAILTPFSHKRQFCPKQNPSLATPPHRGNFERYLQFACNSKLHKAFSHKRSQHNSLRLPKLIWFFCKVIPLYTVQYTLKRKKSSFFPHFFLEKKSFDLGVGLNCQF